jgi:hypothetical protein
MAFSFRNVLISAAPQFKPAPSTTSRSFFPCSNGPPPGQLFSLLPFHCRLPLFLTRLQLQLLLLFLQLLYPEVCLTVNSNGNAACHGSLALGHHATSQDHSAIATNGTRMTAATSSRLYFVFKAKTPLQTKVPEHATRHNANISFASTNEMPQHQLSEQLLTPCVCAYRQWFCLGDRTNGIRYTPASLITFSATQHQHK